jgi:hypothetical protein
MNERQQDRAWADYSARFRQTILPALVDATHLLTIVSGSDPADIDLRAATELGLMLLLDKPLVVVVPVGETIPAALRRAAHVVLDEFDVTDPACQDQIVAALERITGAEP